MKTAVVTKNLISKLEKPGYRKTRCTDKKSIFVSFVRIIPSKRDTYYDTVQNIWKMKK